MTILNTYQLKASTLELNMDARKIYTTIVFFQGVFSLFMRITTGVQISSSSMTKLNVGLFMMTAEKSMWHLK